MSRVNVVYHHFPHYRRPVIAALAESQKHSYRFFGGHEDILGIKAFRGDENLTIEQIGLTVHTSGRIAITEYLASLHDCEAIIVIGNPNISATWKIAIFARLIGIKVLFWAHGWLKPEPWPKRVMRNLYFRLAHRVLVYGERAVELAKASGFPKERVRVIYNSLDVEAHDNIFWKLEKIPITDLRCALRLDPTRPCLLAVSRLTDICRYDWLIEAASLPMLAEKSPQLVFIGEGPEQMALMKQAKALNVDAVFLGAIYDEETVGRHVMAANVVVSPGKVGLTAMHALAFGTPVVTHGSFDNQMPEVEAIEPGISGMFFEYGNVQSLAEAIFNTLHFPGSPAERRTVCREIIARKYHPEVQRALIDEAIDELVR